MGWAMVLLYYKPYIHHILLQSSPVLFFFLYPPLPTFRHRLQARELPMSGPRLSQPRLILQPRTKRSRNPRTRPRTRQTTQIWRKRKKQRLTTQTPTTERKVGFDCQGGLRACFIAEVLLMLTKVSGNAPSTLSSC